MFCAGADVTMAKQIADPENGERFSYFMQTTLCGLRNLKIPSYAAVQGRQLIHTDIRLNKACVSLIVRV